MSVDRLDHDKEADENVNGDHVRTGRTVESEKSIGLFTPFDEVDIDFRVSGLPHAVVKQVGWIIGKVGIGSSWQLSWHASSAILAQGRRCQQAAKIFESFFPRPLTLLLQMAVSLGPRRWCPNGFACVRHKRCLNAESGARRRRAAAPEAADGILRELPFHRARAEQSGAPGAQALVAAAGCFLDDQFRRGRGTCLAQDTLLWAMKNTPFQESDALWMMFRFPWAVLLCLVVGTVDTLLLGLLFQMLHRAGLSRSQSHSCRASGVIEDITRGKAALESSNQVT